MWRLEEDVGERDWEDGKAENLTHGLKLAFTDIKTYMLMVIVFGIVSSGSVTNFFPTYGFFFFFFFTMHLIDVRLTSFIGLLRLWVTTGSYPFSSRLHHMYIPFSNRLPVDAHIVQALAVITTFCNSLHADKTGERYFHITIPLVFGVASFIIAATTTTTAPRYLAMMLMVPSVYSGYVVSLAWISNTLPRPPAKRAAAIAAINAFSNASSIWTAYAYPTSDGPRYIGAMSMNCGTAVLSIVAATVLRWHLRKLNRRLEAGEHVDDAMGAGFRFLN
jgi:hypothetical protein